MSLNIYRCSSGFAKQIIELPKRRLRKSETRRAQAKAQRSALRRLITRRVMTYNELSKEIQQLSYRDNFAKRNC
jgi:shikimate kinase